MRVSIQDLSPRDEARVRVHEASTALEARSVAAALDAAGLEYALETEPRSDGAVFYVGAGDGSAARTVAIDATVWPGAEAPP